MENTVVGYNQYKIDVSINFTRPLPRAAATGFADSVPISQDPDLAALHARDDVQRLVAELFDRIFPADPFAR